MFITVVAIHATLTSSTYAVVIYDEGVSGDLPNNKADPLPNFVLVEGENKVKGVIEPPADGSDNFEFIVPEGLKLDNIIVEQSNDDEPDPFAFYISELHWESFEPDDGWTLILYNLHNDTPSGGTSLIDLTPETIEPIETPPLTNDDIYPVLPSPDPYKIEFKVALDPTYTITFITSPIPEPGTLILLTIGGAALLCRQI